MAWLFYFGSVMNGTAVSFWLFHFQSVTGVDSSDDHNSYWQVRGKTGTTCTRGYGVFVTFVFIFRDHFPDIHNHMKLNVHKFI